MNSLTRSWATNDQENQRRAIVYRAVARLNTVVLTHLSIASLTLVERLELEFEPGMSVITGETGAGKSILLGALGLALGERADSSLIALGAKKAEINASFDVKDHPDAKHWLTARELEDEDGLCILRRVISREGRSRAFVNGSPITLTELATLSGMLLDIHAQHEHQSLLKKESHLRLLDEYGELSKVTADVSIRFHALSDITARLNQLRADMQAQSSRVQLLSYQAEELNELAVQTGETEQLEKELKRLNVADSAQHCLSQVADLCSKEQDNSASSMASRALSLLETIDEVSIEPIREMLASAQIQIDEAMADLDAAMDTFASDPARLVEVEDRIGRIYETARKHKVSPEQLCELTLQIQQQLDDITNADATIAALETEVVAAREDYQHKAGKLSKARKQTARRLQSEVTEQLQSLGMNGATFEVCVKSGDERETGTDDIEFLISTIPGSVPGSLAKIASGGELSRISLAIQVITAKTSKTPTLVFDEVDVGVGGAIAEVIGKKLRTLGQDAQIICVTHLPQVAAQGHHHYVVQKSTSETGASTLVRSLSEEEKVDEIARMLGGIEKTEQTRAHAAEMVQRAEG